MFSFDIKSGLHNVEIFSSHQCFLGFHGITRIRLDTFSFESFPMAFLRPLISLLRFLDLSSSPTSWLNSLKLLLFLERVGTSIYLCPPLLERNSLSGKTILGLWMVDLSDSDKFLPVSIRAIGTPVVKDTSCYDWVWENNWLVLLVSLIPRLSGILRIIKLRVLLSYPNWAPSRSGPCSSCSSLLTIPLSGASLLLLTLQEFLSGASPSPFSTHPSLTH